MKIPDELRIPAIVFGLEGILITGAALVFIVLVRLVLLVLLVLLVRLMRPVRLMRLMRPVLALFRQCTY